MLTKEELDELTGLGYSKDDIVEIYKGDIDLEKLYSVDHPDRANIEDEKWEYVFDKSNLIGFEEKGNTHKNGGNLRRFPTGTQIYSDNFKIKKSELADILEIPMKIRNAKNGKMIDNPEYKKLKEITPGELVRNKFDISKFSKKLLDKDADELDKSTSMMMINKFTPFLDKVFLAQELTKYKKGQENDLETFVQGMLSQQQEGQEVEEEVQAKNGKVVKAQNGLFEYDKQKQLYKRQNYPYYGTSSYYNENEMRNEFPDEYKRIYTLNNPELYTTEYSDIGDGQIVRTDNLYDFEHQMSIIQPELVNIPANTKNIIPEKIATNRNLGFDLPRMNITPIEIPRTLQQAINNPNITPTTNSTLKSIIEQFKNQDSARDYSTELPTMVTDTYPNPTLDVDSVAVENSTSKPFTRSPETSNKSLGKIDLSSNLREVERATALQNMMRLGMIAGSNAQFETPRYFNSPYIQNKPLDINTIQQNNINKQLAQLNYQTSRMNVDDNVKASILASNYNKANSQDYLPQLTEYYNNINNSNNQNLVNTYNTNQTRLLQSLATTDQANKQIVGNKSNYVNQTLRDMLESNINLASQRANLRQQQQLLPLSSTENMLIDSNGNKTFNNSGKFEIEMMKQNMNRYENLVRSSNLTAEQEKEKKKLKKQLGL